MPTRVPSLAITLLLATTGLAAAQQTQTTGTNSGAVELSTSSAPSTKDSKVTPVPQNVKPQALKLTDDQRETIRKELTLQHNDLTVAKTASQAEKDYQGGVGTTIPGPLHEKEEAMPAQLTREIPALKEYTYLKLNKQILLIDPTAHKVVEQMPEG